MGPNPRRSIGIDLARLLGLAAVGFGHVWTQPGISGWVYTWHVPLFFIVSGYLWSDRRGLIGELRQRNRRLLIPYAVWLALLIAAYELASELHHHEFDGRVAVDSVWGGDHAGRPFSTFWFITALFFAVALTKLVRIYPPPVQIGIAILGLTTGYLWGPVLAGSPLAVGMALPCMFYLTAGIALRWVFRRWALPSWVAVVLLAIPLLTVGLGWDQPMDMKSGNMGTPVLGAVVAILISAGLILAANRVAPRVERFRHAIEALTAASLVFVLVHPAVLWLLGTPATGRLADFLLALVAPFALGVLLVRTPLAAPLTGQQPRSGRSTPAVGRSPLS